MELNTIDLVENDDDKHCLQAAILTVLQYFRPDADEDMKKLEEITRFDPAKPTWPFAGWKLLLDHGLSLRNIEPFSPELFGRDPKESIRQQAGDEAVAKAIIEASDLNTEVQVLADVVRHEGFTFEVRKPEWTDLTTAATGHSLLMCNVDSRVLNGREGYAGHFVVVSEVYEDWITLHDPGLPVRANWQVARDDFIAAWHSPTDTMANVLIIKDQSGGR
ncbi:MAG: hypothetical protein WDZ42_00675 [Candidatus Saccharimonadales bacterium]